MPRWRTTVSASPVRDRARDEIPPLDALEEVVQRLSAVDDSAAHDKRTLDVQFHRATLLTYDAVVTPSLEAAGKRGRRGRGDRPSHADAVRQGGDLPVARQDESRAGVHEDVKTLGLGAELSAVIMEEKFDALDAPVLCVTCPDTHPPFSLVLEAYNLPNTDKITEAPRTLVAY